MATRRKVDQSLLSVKDCQSQMPEGSCRGERSERWFSRCELERVFVEDCRRRVGAAERELLKESCRDEMRCEPV